MSQPTSHRHDSPYALCNPQLRSIRTYTKCTHYRHHFITSIRKYKRDWHQTIGIDHLSTCIMRMYRHYTRHHFIYTYLRMWLTADDGHHHVSTCIIRMIRMDTISLKYQYVWHQMIGIDRLCPSCIKLQSLHDKHNLTAGNFPPEWLFQQELA